jgi:phytanoyl-CoA hydroxylase
MEANALKARFDRDGFCVKRQFLPPAEFAALRRELDRYIAEVVPTLPDSHAFYEDRTRPETLKQMQHMSVDPFFQASCRNPHWTALASHLLGEPAEPIGAAEWFDKPPGTKHPTPPHQDNYYFHLEPGNILTMWLALEDVDEENGCLRYVRGSHRRGRLPHAASGELGFSQGLVEFGPAEVADEEPAILRANDLAIHHGWTIHRAEPNRSAARHRRSFVIAYRGASCRVDEAAAARYREQLRQQHQTLGLRAASGAEA